MPLPPPALPSDSQGAGIPGQEPFHPYHSTLPDPPHINIFHRCIPQMHSQVEGRIRETGNQGFQDEDSLCPVIQLPTIYATPQALVDFMSIHLRHATCQDMYEQNLPPVSLADLHKIFKTEVGEQIAFRKEDH